MSDSDGRRRNPERVERGAQIELCCKGGRQFPNKDRKTFSIEPKRTGGRGLQQAKSGGMAKATAWKTHQIQVGVKFHAQRSGAPSNQFERSGHCCSVVAQHRGSSRDTESFSMSKNCTPNPAG